MFSSQGVKNQLFDAWTAEFFFNIFVLGNN